MFPWLFDLGFLVNRVSGVCTGVNSDSCVHHYPLLSDVVLYSLCN